MCRLAAVLGAIVAVAPQDPAVAQTVDQTTIDQRLQQAIPEGPFAVSPAGGPANPLGTLLLLRQRDFFTFAVNGGASYTSNAFLRDKDRDEDVMFTLDASLRAATVIDERFEIFAEIAGYGLRYLENDELDVGGARGRLGASTSIAGFDVGFAYSPTIAWDKDFDKHLVTLHPLLASVSHTITLGTEVLLIPSVAAGYTFADPSDFAAANAQAGVTAAWLPLPDLSLFLTPSVGYRHYTDYFESLTGETREDWSFGALFGLNYLPLPNAIIQVAVGVNANNSSIEPLDYEAFTVSPSVRFSMRF